MKGAVGGLSPDFVSARLDACGHARAAPAVASTAAQHERCCDDQRGDELRACVWRSSVNAFHERLPVGWQRPVAAKLTVGTTKVGRPNQETGLVAADRRPGGRSPSAAAPDHVAERVMV